jgi:hypothetical protein
VLFSVDHVAYREQTLCQTRSSSNGFAQVSDNPADCEPDAERAPPASGGRTESPGESSNQKVNNRVMHPRLLAITGPEQGVSYPIAMDSFAIQRCALPVLSAAAWIGSYGPAETF